VHKIYALVAAVSSFHVLVLCVWNKKLYEFIDETKKGNKELRARRKRSRALEEKFVCKIISLLHPHAP
jgi:hypothetical protein